MSRGQGLWLRCRPPRGDPVERWRVEGGLARHTYQAEDPRARARSRQKIEPWRILMSGHEKKCRIGTAGPCTTSNDTVPVDLLRRFWAGLHGGWQGSVIALGWLRRVGCGASELVSAAAGRSD